MTQAVLVGGLGDGPLSLFPLDAALKRSGIESKFVETPVYPEWAFADRVRAVTSAIEAAAEPEPVYVIGQSAGGLAALIAASNLRECEPKKVLGVIAVSPAMPRGINPLGWPLVSRMWRYQLDMLRRRLIIPSEDDYRYVALNGLSKEDADRLVSARRPISGREANQLATPWLQPKLGPLDVPVVYVWGGRDRWVAPRAHRRFVRLLEQKNSGAVVEWHFPEGGHLLIHDEKFSREVVEGALAPLL